MAQAHSRLERQMLAACMHVTAALDTLQWLFEDNMDTDLTQLRIELDERLELRDKLEADYQFYSKYVRLLALAPEE